MSDPHISVKEFFTLWLERLETQLKETDRRYDERFSAQEKAVAKAEAAQQAYNERSNEFRAALDDQGKLMMPRTEALQGYAQLRELIETQGKLISELQRQYSRGEGGVEVSVQRRSQSNWIIALIVTIAIAIVGFAITMGLAIYQMLNKGVAQ